MSVFEHAAALFDPTPSSVLLWTRLSEDMTWASWTLARDPELTDVVASGGAVDRARPRPHGRRRRRRPRAGDDLLVPLLGRGEELSPVGRTRTLPASPVDCVPHRHGVLRPVFRGAARRLPGAGRAGSRPRAAPRRLHLRGRRREGPARRTTRPHDGDHARTTTGGGSPSCASDPDAQALHLRHPMIAIWDDHDLSDNAWREGAKHHDPGTARAVGRAGRRRGRRPPGVVAGPAARRRRPEGHVALDRHRRPRRAGAARHEARRTRPSGRRRRSTTARRSGSFAPRRRAAGVAP